MACAAACANRLTPAAATMARPSAPLGPAGESLRFSFSGWGPQLDKPRMCPPVVEQRDRSRIDRHAVEGRCPDAAAPALRIENGDLVAAVEELPGDPVFGPRGRNARIDDERGAATAEPQDAFDPGTVHPAGGAGVPPPPAASGVRCARVDVAGHHVRLRLVADDVARR